MLRLADVPDARLAQLTRELERDLSRAGIRAQAPQAPMAPGDRGDPITLGALALALITSGAVASMIDCLKAYLTRERALTIKLTRSDGAHVEVTSRNIDAPALREALEAVVSTPLD
jgi:hypothetical protein